MRRYFALAATGFALLALPMPAVAQEEGHAGHDCPAGTAVTLPPELASWNARVPLAAATEADTLRAATLIVGKAVNATLAHTSEVKYPVRPEQPGGSVSYGGIFAFTVDQAGTYRVAQGAGAWIDVIKDGKAIDSIAHGHGPDCSDVRKVVDFPLTPGTYTLQVAANAQAELPLLVTRLP